MPQELVFIKDLARFEGDEVQLSGWVSGFRSSGGISFLILRDGSGQCQCVFSEKETAPQSLKLFSDLSLESFVRIKGLVKKWKQSFEIKAREMEILSPSKDYPIAKKAHGVDFLLKHRHLWLRSRKQRALLSIRSEVTRHIHGFFQKEGFQQVSAPVLQPTACEGSSSLFAVDFFDKDPVFLSQSGQLYMEAASAALGRVYCFGPTFRAEKSSTRRHLLEFWMIEPEMAFCSFEECLALTERFVEYVVQSSIQTAVSHLEALGRDLNQLKNVKAPFPRLSYNEAVEILKKENPDLTPGKELGAKDESLLGGLYDRPVFIHRYPKAIKAFYMKEDPKDPSLSLSFDLLASESYGELIGGSQREDNIEILRQNIKAFGLDEKAFSWYLDLRRYGSFPHSGFGLGLERLLSWICGLDHVRESIPFPRLYGRDFFEKACSEPAN